MIEAMACGSPLIAQVLIDSSSCRGWSLWIPRKQYRGTSAGGPQREQVIARKPPLDFEKRFTVDLMVDQYDRVYRSLIAQKAPARELEPEMRPNSRRQQIVNNSLTSPFVSTPAKESAVD